MNWIGESYQSSEPATDILLDGMRIHDFTKHTAGAHMSTASGSDNVDGIIDPEYAHLDLRPLLDHLRERPTSGSAVRNALLENNFFDCCDPSGGGYLRNRLRRGGWAGDDPLQLDDARNRLAERHRLGAERPDHIDSNVIATTRSANCSRATWRYNVVAVRQRLRRPQARDRLRRAIRLDLHLVAGAAAINAGNPSSYPATDIDGDARPAGGRADAGADERLASAHTGRRLGMRQGVERAAHPISRFARRVERALRAYGVIGAARRGWSALRSASRRAPQGERDPFDEEMGVSTARDRPARVALGAVRERASSASATSPRIPRRLRRTIAELSRSRTRSSRSSTSARERAARCSSPLSSRSSASSASSSPRSSTRSPGGTSPPMRIPRSAAARSRPCARTRPSTSFPDSRWSSTSTTHSSSR